MVFCPSEERKGVAASAEGGKDQMLGTWGDRHSNAEERKFSKKKKTPLVK